MVSTQKKNTPPRRRPGVLGKLALFGFALAISFVFCEVAARIALPAPPKPSREPQIRYVFNDDIGFVQIPGESGWIDDGFVSVNSLGFRGPEPASPKPDGTFRVMVLGDSCTVGWGVNDDETYPAQLQELLSSSEFRGPSKIEVFNFSVSGYGPSHEARVLKKFAPLVEPDVVIVGITWGDVPWEQSRPDGRAAPTGDGFTFEDGPAGGTFQLVHKPSFLNALLRQSRAIYAAGRGYHHLKSKMGWRSNQAEWEQAILTGMQTPTIDNVWREYEESLNKIVSITQSHNAPLVALVIPFRPQVGHDYPNAQYQSRVTGICKRLDITLVDPLAQFIERRGEIDEIFIPYDQSHLRRKGYGLIARALFDTLKQESDFFFVPDARTD